MPSPPTDNLYKFLSISGLLIAGVGLVAPLFLTRDYLDRSIRRRIETEDRSHALIFKFTDLFQKDEFKDEVKRIRAMSEADKNLEVLMRNEREHYNAEVRDNRAILDAQLEQLAACRFIGGFIACSGFILWWRRGQRHQDELARTEPEKHRLEMDELRKKLVAEPTEQKSKAA